MRKVGSLGLVIEALDNTFLKIPLLQERYFLNYPLVHVDIHGHVTRYMHLMNCFQLQNYYLVFLCCQSSVNEKD